MQSKQEEYGKATAHKSDKHSKSSDPKSGQFAKKARTQFPRTALPMCGRRIARVVQPNSGASSAVGHSFKG